MRISKENDLVLKGHCRNKSSLAKHMFCDVIRAVKIKCPVEIYTIAVEALGSVLTP